MSYDCLHAKECMAIEGPSLLHIRGTDGLHARQLMEETIRGQARGMSR